MASPSSVSAWPWPLNHPVYLPPPPPYTHTHFPGRASLYSLQSPVVSGALLGPSEGLGSWPAARSCSPLRGKHLQVARQRGATLHTVATGPGRQYQAAAIWMAGADRLRVPGRQDRVISSRNVTAAREWRQPVTRYICPSRWRPQRSSREDSPTWQPSRA